MDAPIIRLDQYSSPRPHIFAPEARVSLEITRGRVQQRIRPIRGRVFLIGTASDCDLVLGDLSFPEAYAYIFVSDGSVTIRRLGEPPLYVCGEAVTTGEVFHGDLLSFGPFEMRVIVDFPERLHDDDAWPIRVIAPAAISTDRCGAIDEVRALLLDISRTLSDEPSVSRWYSGRALA